MPMVKIEETEEVCANCEHYQQHYVMMSSNGGRTGTWHAVNRGFCTKPRVKDRFPLDTCNQFHMREVKR